MARRIAREIVIEIATGGFEDGNPEWGTAERLEGIATSFSVRHQTDTVDTSGIGEFNSRIRAAGSHRFTVSAEVMVSGTSYPLIDTNGVMVGHYARVGVKPISTATTYNIWEGVITNWELSTNKNERQTIKFEIEGPADI